MLFLSLSRNYVFRVDPFISDQSRLFWTFRASTISDLPINLQLSHKRVPSLIATQLNNACSGQFKAPHIFLAKLLSFGNVKTLYRRAWPRLTSAESSILDAALCRNQFLQPCRSSYKKLSGTQTAITTALTTVGSVLKKFFIVQHEQVPCEYWYI